MNTTFDNFVKQNPNWKTSLEPFWVYKRDHDRYQRIMIGAKESHITHFYHATINVETGDIYLDCRKRKIFAKHVTLAVVRPIHTIVKTIWHLTLIGPLVQEVNKSLFHGQDASHGVRNFGNSCLDIVRTPFYGIAMTLHHLYAIVEALFSPNSLYESRDRIGALERKMLRIDRITDDAAWKLSVCFSPIRNIATIGKDNDQRQKNLQEYALSLIEFRQENRAPFNDCCMLHPTNTPYISAAAA